jgi:hypothetical protein
MKRPFLSELDELQQRLLEMGGLVEFAIHRSVRSLIDRDASSAQLIWDNENSRRGYWRSTSRLHVIFAFLRLPSRSTATWREWATSRSTSFSDPSLCAASRRSNR